MESRVIPESERQSLPEPMPPAYPELDMQPDWMTEKQWDAYIAKLDRRRERVDKKAAATIEKIDKAYERVCDELSDRLMNDEITEEQYEAESDRLWKINIQLTGEAEAEADASTPPVPLPTPPTTPTTTTTTTSKPTKCTKRKADRPLTDTSASAPATTSGS